MSHSLAPFMCDACGCTKSLPAQVHDPRSCEGYDVLPCAGRACAACGTVHGALSTPTRRGLGASKDMRALVAAGLLARPVSGRYGLALTESW